MKPALLASPSVALPVSPVVSAAGSPPVSPVISAAPSAVGSEPSAPSSALLAAFGPLGPYLNDPAVTDIFVNGHEELWVDRGGGPERMPGWSCPGEQRLREFAVRLVARGGRHLDDSAPCVDVRVEGARVHVVLPPVAVRGTTISVRVPRGGHPRLDELGERGLFGEVGSGPNRDAAVRRRVIEHAVSARVNLLITGAGGVGNTTCHL